MYTWCVVVVRLAGRVGSRARPDPMGPRPQGPRQTIPYGVGEGGPSPSPDHTIWGGGREPTAPGPRSRILCIRCVLLFIWWVGSGRARDPTHQTNTTTPHILCICCVLLFVRLVGRVGSRARPDPPNKTNNNSNTPHAENVVRCYFVLCGGPGHTNQNIQKSSGQARSQRANTWARRTQRACTYPTAVTSLVGFKKAASQMHEF